MTRGIFFFLIFFVQFLAFNQSQLLNVYSSYSKVYNGTEDGGISGSESYVFLTNKTVVIANLKWEGKEIYLTKRDSLVIVVETYTPYNSYRQFTENDSSSNPVDDTLLLEWEQLARIWKHGNTYYVRIPYPKEWDGIVRYSFKGKNFAAAKKAEFDDGYTGFAP